MLQVTLKMTDLLEEKEITRTISAINAYSSGDVCWEKRNEDEQRKNLERWISERGNDQHDTILQLESWEFHA